MNGGTPVGLVEFGTVPMAPLAVAIFGLGITIAMMALKWQPAILLGIVFSTIFAIILNYAMGKDVGFLPGTAVMPERRSSPSPDFSLIGAFDFGAFDKLGVAAAVLWIFSLMLSDFFDTMGTLVGVGGQAGYLDEKGKLPQVNRPLLVDSLAAVAGGACRLVVGDDLHRVGRRRRRRRPHRLGRDRRRRALPAGDVLLAHRRRRAGPGDGAGADRRRLPDDGDADQGGGGRRHDPAAECKAAIDFGDLAFGLPAVLTMTIMPLTYSITNGIGFGFIAYVLIRVVQGKAREVNWLLWVASIAFVIYFIWPYLDAKGWV